MTKECPSCMADVPEAALRCKHCFHDFTEEPAKRSGLIGLMVTIAAMAIVGAATFAYIFYFNAAEKIVVDAETQSIVITRKTATETSTERVEFAKVEKVEHVMGGDQAMFEIVAVTLDGSRYIVERSDDKPLTGKAEHVAAATPCASLGQPLLHFEATLDRASLKWKVLPGE